MADDLKSWKVITVNIHITDVEESRGNEEEQENLTYKAAELTEVNQYLEDGYVIHDRFVTTTENANCFNITFILVDRNEKIKSAGVWGNER